MEKKNLTETSSQEKFDVRLTESSTWTAVPARRPHWSGIGGTELIYGGKIDPTSDGAFTRRKQLFALICWRQLKTGLISFSFDIKNTDVSKGKEDLCQQEVRQLFLYMSSKMFILGSHRFGYQGNLRKEGILFDLHCTVTIF